MSTPPFLSVHSQAPSHVAGRTSKLFVDVVDARLWIYGFMTLWSLRLSVFVKSFTLSVAYVADGREGGQDLLLD